MEKIDIGQIQAAQFETAIIADIEAYVQNHQAEYEAFLKEEYADKGEC